MNSMNTKLIAGVVLVGALGVAGFIVAGGFSPNTDIKDVAEVEHNGVEVTLHKSPFCGCCGEYSQYLYGKGYTINTEETQDMDFVKKELGVPYELESCHTMEIAGYVIEGHVPEEAIMKLLADKPDIKGIGMAGMPSGSPGMPGPKNEDFVVYEITHEGEKGNVFIVL